MPKMPIEDKLGRMLSPEEVARDLGVSLGTFQNRSKEKRPPGMRVPGGRLMYPEKLYWRWKEQHAAQSGIMPI